MTDSFHLEAAGGCSEAEAEAVEAVEDEVLQRSSNVASKSHGRLRK